MADKVVLMKDGHILQTGAPEELYNRPLDTFVAEFVGAPPMALIGAAALPGFAPDRVLGLRAEKVTLAPAGQGRLDCTVSESEFLGAETLIGLSHPQAKGLCVLRPGLALMPVGAEVSIRFDDRDLHVFDATGRRVDPD